MVRVVSVVLVFWAMAPACGSDAIVALLEPEFESIEDILDRYVALEAAFAEEGDARGIFVGMLRVVTADAAVALDQGYFDDPDWTIEFLKSFNDLYREALLNYELGRFDRVPEAWRVAFDAAGDPRVGAFAHALLGIHAHVNRDLPIAIAAMTPAEQRAERYDDFIRTNAFLISTIDVVEDLVAGFEPELSRLDSALGLFDELLLKSTLTRWRLGSWRAAGRLDPDRGGRAWWFAVLLEYRTGENARAILRQARS